MEQFMFIYRGGDFTKLPPEEAQANMQQWFAWMEELRNENRLISTGPLQPVGKQITGKRKTVTDGPFSEAKEIVGGYTIITAQNLEEATKIAEGCPALTLDGMVEIRPLRNVMR